jgi:Uma2 family endonuclease
MSAQPSQYLTLQQYFTLEESGDRKHEYYHGAIYAMTGASARHNLIVANLIGLLHGQLRGSSCRIFPSDLRLKIQATGLYTYPDISVICGGIQFGDGRQDTVTNPTVLIEVLSPSTENYDRGKKFEHYRTIESLQEYIVVAQDRVHIEQHIRQDEHRWLLVDFFAVDQIVQIGAVDCTLPVALVYEYVSFDIDDA